MATPYQQQAPSGLRSPSYSPSPNRKILITGQGTLSKPVPPARVTGDLRPLLPAPTSVSAPGAAGTI